jgi:hypothetical protein
MAGENYSSDAQPAHGRETLERILGIVVAKLDGADDGTLSADYLDTLEAIGVLCKLWLNDDGDDGDGDDHDPVHARKSIRRSRRPELDRRREARANELQRLRRLR